ncbi:hypothetical protein, partial [Stutzerimonas stutzeri]|uniref:hypothetical protein n=1 Tax=Stutzerimonas stutzeri TaxID=316 RepID=UPI001C91BE4E
MSVGEFRNVWCQNTRGSLGSISAGNDRPLLADSVEKVALAAASRSDVPAVEVAASHFKLPSGVSLSVLAQV